MPLREESEKRICRCNAPSSNVVVCWCFPCAFAGRVGAQVCTPFHDWASKQKKNTDLFVGWFDTDQFSWVSSKPCKPLGVEAEDEAMMKKFGKKKVRFLAFDFFFGLLSLFSRSRERCPCAVLLSFYS